MTKELLDPCKKAQGLTLPKEIRDLTVLAKNRYLMDFDNVSQISPAMSDALSRLSTGSGFSIRKNYSDDEEVTFGGANPILMNGIPNFVEKQDLQGRTITLTLPRIADSQRKAEKDLRPSFQERKPYILGAILDLLVNGLKFESLVKPTDGPRMMDSYCWLLACERGTGFNLGESYHTHSNERLGDMARDDLLVQTLLEYLTGTKSQVWQGTATDLYNGLKGYWPDATQKEKNQIPGNAKVLSNRLREADEAMSKIGVILAFNRTKKARSISIDATAFFEQEAGPETESLPSQTPPVEPLKTEAATAAFAATNRVTTPLLPADIPCSLFDSFPDSGVYRLRCHMSLARYAELTEAQRTKLRLAYTGTYIMDVSAAEFTPVNGKG